MHRLDGQTDGLRRYVRRDAMTEIEDRTRRITELLENVADLGFYPSRLAQQRDRHSPSGAELAIRRENCGRVRRAVMKLAPDQQEAIRLAYFDGLTQQAIADRLGKPLGTVKARIRRGIGKLRDQF